MPGYIASGDSFTLLLLSESNTSGGNRLTLIGTVLLVAAFGRGGFLGGVRCFLRPIRGEMSKLVVLKHAK